MNHLLRYINSSKNVDYMLRYQYQCLVKERRYITVEVAYAMELMHISETCSMLLPITYPQKDGGNSSNRF